MSARFSSARRSTLAIAALGVTAIVASLSAQNRQAPVVDRSAKVGAGVYEIAFNGSRNELYVASATATAPNTPKVSVLDPTTLELKRSFDMDGTSPYGLGFNERTQTLYTSNTRTNNVSAIDVTTGKIIATIAEPGATSAHVFRVLPDEEANLVYVSVAATPGRIWVIDGKTNTIAHVINDAGTRPTGLALDRENNRLYAASLGSNEILAIDLTTRAVSAKYPAGGERPTQLAFDAKTNRLFITNQTTNAITVLDTKAGTLLKTIPTGQQALGIGFHAPSNRVFVANRGAGTVSVIDTVTYELVADLKAGTLPNTVAIDPKSGAVFVTNKARAPQGGTVADDEAGDTVTRIRQ